MIFTEAPAVARLTAVKRAQSRFDDSREMGASLNIPVFRAPGMWTRAKPSERGEEIFRSIWK